MPLHLKCRCCGRYLLLEEVFQGAHCRCQYCRSLVQVPRQPQYAAERPAIRPDQPPLAGRPRPNAKRPAKSVSHISSFVSRHPLLASINSFRIVAAFVVIGAISLGVAAWTLTGDSGDSFAFFDSRHTSDGQLSEAESLRLAVLSADPRQSFVGIPIDDNERIGYVVDSDGTMAGPYIDQVSTLLSTTNGANGSDARRFGIMQALDHQGTIELKKVAKAVAGFPGGSRDLYTELAGGVTNLSQAFAVAEKWHVDQMFLVLAKPIDQTEIELLAEHAQQSGAVTHVIALGQAAQQDLSSIAVAGGIFRPVEDKILTELVQLCEEENE